MDRCPQLTDAAKEPRDLGLVGEFGHGDELDALVLAQREALGLRRDHIGDVTSGAGLDERADHRGSRARRCRR